MMDQVFDILACPHCQAALAYNEAENADAQRDLVCTACGRDYPIVRGIPRFIGQRENYAENFGTQWRTYRTVQIDRLSGHKLSETRFVNDTRWDKDWIKGKLILDAGCGAGRFSDVMAQFGANVVACDLSSAVEACRETAAETTGASIDRGTVSVMQADLTALPFKEGSFDAIHCAGVIQHTHDPELVMQALIKYLKPGGRVFYNFYEQSPYSDLQLIKRLLRLTTPSWPFGILQGFCQALCAVFFLPSVVMAKIPVVRAFNRYLPVCSVHPQGIPLAQQYKMTLLDTIDWYGPVYEQRQNHLEVAALLREQGLHDVESDAGRAWGRR
ncbi:MAG: methyltransferase domain-containing protein [Rhodospirillales bacterium]|nr:methyltransferase domain-containing protein [Rhodospirillales bacterium]